MRRIAIAAGALLCGLARPAPAADPLRAVDAADPALLRQGDAVTFRGRPFTGRVVERYPGGARRGSATYAKGRRDGVAEGWYPDGRPAWRGGFRAGREEGSHRAWWPDGKPRLVERFRGGRLEGTVREWFANGRIYREVHYRAGQEAGRQRMWYADGTLRASYVVRHGRRYGLMGAKGCTGEHNGVSGLETGRGGRGG
ncbi:MAG TPA: hypothetical protein VF541_08165 [Longimicrobium sp.]|jgi:antitoxin component YwqK of YwqJK toxin-antitoxin module